MTTEADEKTKNAELKKAWGGTAAATALVAAAFVVAAAVVLVSDYLREDASNPLDSLDLIALKETLCERPRDETVKKEIRALDLELRESFFKRQVRADTGRYVLLGGIAVFLVALKLLATLRRKLPNPGRAGDLQGEEASVAGEARWAVAALGAALVGLGVVVAASSWGILTMERVAVEPAEQKPAADAASWPSPEEIEKNWPRFRGPGGLGVSAYANVPSGWDGRTGEGIFWKTRVPLPGQNSPVLWGERVFLTGADEKTREVYCFDAGSGEVLWRRAVANVPGSSREAPEVMDLTGYAAPTTVTDGRRVYAIFANGDVACFDLLGNRAWARNLGTPENTYGHASSLAAYRDLLLVLLDQGSDEDDKSALLALDASSGRTVWRTERPVPNSWASPILIDTPRGEQVITCGDPWVIAYEPTTGAELWRADCIGGDVAPSPIYAGGLVFAVNAGTQVAALRPDGRGDVTKSHVVWTAWEGLPDTCSPLSDGRLVFLLTPAGRLSCHDAADGTRFWVKDFDANFFSSPALAGDRAYLTSEKGITFVVRAAREYEELGRAELGEECYASPAFCDGRIYMRGTEHLFCIGEK